jgi:glyoxylase-like metal-dependent hydrolase (beta-lactamase superfamily II)
MMSRGWTEPLPILAWAIEHPEGVIVVDSGETARARDPGYFPRSNPYFRFAIRIELSEQDEIGPRLNAVGIDPHDVRWLVLTHLHTDHAGGLHHFEGVETLVSETEYRFATGRMSDIRGYPRRQWPNWFSPRQVRFDGPPVGPFDASHPLTQAGDVVLVPTPGHTPGHLSVLVQPADGVRYLLTGDTSYSQQLMLDGAVDGVSPNPAEYRDTLSRIQGLIRAAPTVYLPAHDPDSTRRLRELEPARPARDTPDA